MGKSKPILLVLISILAAVLITINIVLLVQMKKNTYLVEPVNYLELDKGTIVIVFQEYECDECIKNFLFLNDLYEELKKEGQVDVRLIILSKECKDSKNISSMFVFPVTIVDNFSILKRMNIKETPLLIGISKNHEIVYYEHIPQGIRIDAEYLNGSLIQRLHYSNTFPDGSND